MTAQEEKSEEEKQDEKVDRVNYTNAATVSPTSLENKSK